jgi:alpha-tubulin suppressor-like RCC1 family protein
LAIEGEFYSINHQESGNIYAWGSNSEGQLGNNTKTDEMNPILIFKNLKGLQKIFCGYSFSMILQNGEILSCGRNDQGRLGLGDKKDRSIFEKIKFKHKVKKFHTHGHHSIMLLGNFNILIF